jgi:hypothetical protein
LEILRRRYGDVYALDSPGWQRYIVLSKPDDFNQIVKANVDEPDGSSQHVWPIVMYWKRYGLSIAALPGTDVWRQNHVRMHRLLTSKYAQSCLAKFMMEVPRMVETRLSLYTLSRYMMSELCGHVLLNTSFDLFESSQNQTILLLLDHEKEAFEALSRLAFITEDINHPEYTRYEKHASRIHELTQQLYMLRQPGGLLEPIYDDSSMHVDVLSIMGTVIGTMPRWFRLMIYCIARFPHVARQMLIVPDYIRYFRREMVRMFPIALSLLRSPSIDVDVGGYTIKAGELVFLNRRRDVNMTRPDLFAPERFYGGTIDVYEDLYTHHREMDVVLHRVDDDYNNSQVVQSPFGLGARRCIGEQFVLYMTELLLNQIISHYHIRPVKLTTTISFQVMIEHGVGTEVEFVHR